MEGLLLTVKEIITPVSCYIYREKKVYNTVARAIKPIGKADYENQTQEQVPAPIFCRPESRQKHCCTKLIFKKRNFEM